MTALRTCGFGSKRWRRIASSVCSSPIEPNAKAAADHAAELIARELQANPRLVMGLATGRTMEQVYARLVDMHETSGLDFATCHTLTWMNTWGWLKTIAIHTGST